MKAILIEKPGGPEELKTGEIQKPVPGDYEILVKVHAAALNRADILQREGKYPPPSGASKILGLEISGEVQATGDKVSRWKKGDKIFGLVPGGGYAEYAIINERMANPIPANFTYEEAAAIPEVFLTAYQALVWHAHLQRSEKILIHAGGSGVGTAAIQIARLIGAEIYITASEEKHEICISLGTKKAINYKTEDFSERISEFTEAKGVNVIIDFIAGSYFQKNLKSLSIDGRMVMLATLGGGRDPEADIRQILSKRLTIIGSTLRSRTIDYQVKLNEEFISFAFDKFEQGSLKPVIDKVYDWKEAAEAHRRMEANKNTGKIILKISG